MFADINNLDSSIAYWDYCKTSTYGYCTEEGTGLLSIYSSGGKAYCTSDSGTNCAYVYDTNAENIYSIVNAYANKIGTSAGVAVEGKLMSLEQANSLSTTIRADKNGSSYWFGTPYNGIYVWYASWDGGIYNYVFTNFYGIRPVIVVPTSAL